MLGLGLSFQAVIVTGATSLVIILICVTAAIALTTFIGQKLGLTKKMFALIGVGTSICGATAIVAAAPAIHADDEDSFQVLDCCGYSRSGVDDQHLVPNYCLADCGCIQHRIDLDKRELEQA